jgi:hypothetical protein
MEDKRPHDYIVFGPYFQGELCNLCTPEIRAWITSSAVLKADLRPNVNLQPILQMARSWCELGIGTYMYMQLYANELRRTLIVLFPPFALSIDFWLFAVPSFPTCVSPALPLFLH